MSTDASLRLRRPDRLQVAMRCECDDELIPQEHQARVIWRVVETLDLATFHEPIRARQGVCGRDATDPRLLIALTSASAQSSRGYMRPHAASGRRGSWRG